MAIKYLTDIDLNGNELQNVVLQSLSTAPTAVEGRIYYNTTDDTVYVYANGAWVDALSQGDYTFENGVEEDGNRHVSIKIATGDHAGNVVLTADSNGLSAAVDLSGKVDKNDAITGATKCKITYDAKGLVTSGADLQSSDIPNLDSSKVTTLGSYEKASAAAAIATTDSLDDALGKLEYKADAAVVANAAITAGTGTVITYDAKGLVTGSSELAIKSTSANYLEYDSTNHEFGAKVDTVVTADSTNLVTSGAVKSAINAAITGGVHYAGTWDITSATDYSGITLPQTKGAMFYVTGTGPKTIGGIEWNEGDYLLFNADVAAGGTVTGKVDKIDNSESADIVRLTATQILTNKTIDADDNTISDLTTSNFKSGVIVTSVAAASTASDTAIATEKAVRTELDDKQDKVSAAVENNIATWDDAGNTKDSGKAFATSVAAAGSASNNNIPTEAAVRTELDKKQDLVASATANDIAFLDANGQVIDNGKAVVTSVTSSSVNTDAEIPTAKAVATLVENSMSGAKTSIENPALSVNSGVCTWSITGLAADPMSIVIIEKATGDRVFAGIAYGTKSATISFNSAANIAEKTYVAKILM